jgi:ribosomal protein S18 acetylase RimI-like enzyme
VAHLCHTIFLEVRCSNQAAISLYERNGYTETGKIQKYYADGEDGLQLRRLITDSEESAVNAIRTEDKK